MKDELKPERLRSIRCDGKALLRKGGGFVSEGLLFATQSRVHIARSFVFIGRNDFRKCISLCEVTFSKGSRLRDIPGFPISGSVCRIEIPSTAEIIFSVNSHLREIGGFIGCASHFRIEIPSAIEIITDYGNNIQFRR
jgi:hypothetical protein